MKELDKLGIFDKEITYKDLNEQEKRIYNSVVETLSFHLKRAEIKRIVEVLNLYAGTKPNKCGGVCCI
jgi:hypothetical protein